MNLDEPTMNLDELQARIDEACREDDRLRAERQWQAERRRKEPPMVRKSAPGVLYRDVAPAENHAGENALQCTQPVTSPAPSIDEEYQAGWDRWLRGHLDIERENLIEAIGGALAARRSELLDWIKPQLEKQLGKIGALELKLAELSGAVDVLRGKEPREFVGEQCGQARDEVQAAVAPLQEAIVALKLKLAELTGAVDVLRGKEPPPPAKFPRVKAWMEDTIYHEGDIVAFAGGTFQARRDTASPPGAKGWVCLAKPGNSLTVRGTYNGDINYCCLDVAMINGSSFVALKDMPGPCPGSDWHLLASRGSRGNRGPNGERGFTGLRGERGPDGASITIRGTWDADADYRQLDVVACNGGSFVARCDKPGPCPGKDWQLLASPGMRGERGPKGDKGEPGKVAPYFVGWDIDRASYCAIAKMSDGSEMTLELRPLFEQFLAEVEQRGG